MPKELSASQREFFRYSKIRSKDGRLLTMYHGSDSDFDEFSTPLSWFSADRRYASEYGSRIYACYLDCRRPFVSGDTSLPLFDSGMSADDVDAGFMQAFSMGDGIDDIDLEDDAPFADSRIPVPSPAAEALRAKAKIGKAEFDAILKDVRAQYSDPDADPNGWELRLDALTRSSEFRDALAARGYDSIAAREEGHFCVAAFRPESIKLVSNANPTRSRKIDEGKNANKAVCGPKRIRKVKQSNEGLKSLRRPSRGQNGLVEDSEGPSVEAPSKGKSLSKGQEDFFRNSKIRDGDGNLLVCYHGTKHPGFGSFDSRKGSSQFGRYKFRNANVNYFTTSEHVAAGYTDLGVRSGGNVYACYLNVENPYVLDAGGRGFNGLVDDGLWMVRNDILDRITSEAWTDGELGRLNELLSYLTVHLKPTGRKDSDGNAVYDLHRDANGLSRGVLMYAYTLDELLHDEDAYAELRDQVLGSQDDYYLTTDDVINAVLYMNDYKRENYDGVVFENIADRGPKGMMFGADATDIVTLKSANQIKRISNLNPTDADGLDEANRKPDSQNAKAKYSVVPVNGEFYPLESVLNACFAEIVSDASEKGVYVMRIIKDIVGGESISASESFSSALSDFLAHSSDKDALIFLRRIQLTLLSHQRGTPVFSNKDNSNPGWKVSVSLEGKASLPVYELRWGKGKNNFRSTFSMLKGKLFLLTFFRKGSNKFPEGEKEAAIAVVRQCFKAVPSSVGDADFS